MEFFLKATNFTVFLLSIFEKFKNAYNSNQVPKFFRKANKPYDFATSPASHCTIGKPSEL